MATKLLAKVERLSDKAKLRSLPALRHAAGKVAKALAVLLETSDEDPSRDVSLTEVWAEIERATPRSELTVALEQLDKLAPDHGDGDNDAEWRAELVKRYGSVSSFLGLLARLELGAVDSRRALLDAVKTLPALVGRRRVDAGELDGTLVTGSWRRLVFANPELPAGVADHHAYTFCVLEALHRGAAAPRDLCRAWGPLGRPAHETARWRAVGERQAQSAQGARSARRARRASSGAGGHPHDAYRQVADELGRR